MLKNKNMRLSNALKKKSFESLGCLIVLCLTIDTYCRSSLPNYLDMIVEVCPPHPYESHCFVFPAGHLNRSTTGTFHAEAKIATDNAWWSDHPPSDMTAGIYTTDIAICDGNCVKWLTKPIVLAEIYSRFVIVQNE